MTSEHFRPSKLLTLSENFPKPYFDEIKVVSGKGSTQASLIFGLGLGQPYI